MNNHITIAPPQDCFELTIFTEEECWQMSRDGIITYDEADHMVDGRTLYEARQALASYECPCDQCGAW